VFEHSIFNPGSVCVCVCVRFNRTHAMKLYGEMEV